MPFKNIFDFMDSFEPVSREAARQDEFRKDFTEFADETSEFVPYEENRKVSKNLFDKELFIYGLRFPDDKEFCKIIKELKSLARLDATSDKNVWKEGRAYEKAIGSLRKSLEELDEEENKLHEEAVHCFRRNGSWMTDGEIMAQPELKKIYFKMNKKSADLDDKRRIYSDLVCYLEAQKRGRLILPKPVPATASYSATATAPDTVSAPATASYSATATVPATASSPASTSALDFSHAFPPDGSSDGEAVYIDGRNKKFDYGIYKYSDIVTKLQHSYGKSVDVSAYPLFPHEPNANDVSQGALGDCYYVASLSNIANLYPDKLKESICENPDGKTVTVKLYSKTRAGQYKPVYVTLDKEIGQFKLGKLPVAGSGGENCLWVNCFERALILSGLYSSYTASKGDHWESVPSDIEEQYKRIKKLVDEKKISKAELLEEKEKYPYIFANLDEDHAPKLIPWPNYDSIDGGIMSAVSEMLLGPEYKGTQISLTDALDKWKKKNPVPAGQARDRQDDNAAGQAKARPDASASGPAKAKQDADEAGQAKARPDVSSAVPANEKAKEVSYNGLEMKVYNLLKDAHNRGIPAGAGSHVSKIPDMHVFEKHAYAVMDVYLDKKTGYRYVRLRNPWGRSDNHFKMFAQTNAIRTTIDANGKRTYEEVHSENGFFDMELTDFIHDFSHIYLNGINNGRERLDSFEGKRKNFVVPADLNIFQDKDTAMRYFCRLMTAAQSQGSPKNLAKTAYNDPHFSLWPVFWSRFHREYINKKEVPDKFSDRVKFNARELDLYTEFLDELGRRLEQYYKSAEAGASLSTAAPGQTSTRMSAPGSGITGKSAPDQTITRMSAPGSNITGMPAHAKTSRAVAEDILKIVNQYTAQLCLPSEDKKLIFAGEKTKALAQGVPYGAASLHRWTKDLLRALESGKSFEDTDRLNAGYEKIRARLARIKNENLQERIVIGNGVTSEYDLVDGFMEITGLETDKNGIKMASVLQDGISRTIPFEEICQCSSGVFIEPLQIREVQPERENTREIYQGFHTPDITGKFDFRTYYNYLKCFSDISQAYAMTDRPFGGKSSAYDRLRNELDRVIENTLKMEGCEYAQFRESLEALRTAVADYNTHCLEKPIDNWRRNNRVRITNMLSDILAKADEMSYDPAYDIKLENTKKVVLAMAERDGKVIREEDLPEMARHMLSDKEFRGKLEKENIYSLKYADSKMIRNEIPNIKSVTASREIGKLEKALKVLAV